ncbi:MAG: PTS sugar transporter subunit IIA [Arachnia sp.]
MPIRTNVFLNLALERDSTMTTDNFRALPEVCVLNLEADSGEEVLRILAAKALAAGLVTATFADALVAREHTHPTGLPTAVPVAIPHADAEHVLGSGLAVATLAHPVRFGEMGGAGAQLEVAVVLMLLVSQPHEQVEVLTRIIDIVQGPAWETPLRLAESPAELAAAFNLQLAARRG